MSEIEQLITRSGLQTWHKYEAGVSGHHIIYDYSGNNRTIQCSIGNEPVLTSNVLNGQPGWYFNGSRTPLAYTGSFTAKHVFVVASYADAVFPTSPATNDHAGLLTGLDSTNTGILVGNPATTKFYNFGLGVNYRRRDVAFAESDMQAAMSNAHSIFEASNSTGWALDGIQVGQDREDTARKWKGYFFEQLIYNRVLSDSERFDIYAYLAMKFRLWKRTAAGLNVFPFQPEWSMPLGVSKRALASISVSGAFKGRSKGTKKIGLEPQFEDRIPEEYDTAVEFWDQHYPGSSFIFRDDSYSPSRDTEMRFISDVTASGFDFRARDYTFQAFEV